MMADTRFLSKTNQQHSITTTLVVVVMLLLFMTSCGKESKEIVEVVFDPEHTYTMRTTDMTSLISDSGITRYRLQAKEWLMYNKAKEPYTYLPQGVYVEKFDSLFNIEASIKADTGYYWEKKGLYKLIGNVSILSLEGRRLNTSLLFIDDKADKIHTDKYFELQEGEKIITGIGFESNQNMTKYKIFNSQGTFPVSDRAPKDTISMNPDVNEPDATRISSIEQR